MITVISKNTNNSKLFYSKRNDFDNSLYELEKIFKKSYVSSDALEEYEQYKRKRKIIEKMKKC
ncbi:hypothetical protein DW615_15255 [Enterococcus faecalis]|nr:hypothetical protein [Enterococcus faecalis]PQB41544.1 hypothetical protein CUM82_04830 [Enterococcus faecalis]